MKKNNVCEVVETEDADREAYFPIAAVVQNEDYIIRTCDGDHEYLYLAMRKKGGYSVAEVYPGLSQRNTRVRDLKDAKDLVVGTFKNIEQVVTVLQKVVFEGFEFGQREHAAMTAGGVRALRAVAKR